MKAWRVCSLLLFGACISFAGEQKDVRTVATEFVRRAGEQSDIATPVQLRGTFRLAGGKLEGTYEFTQVSPDEQQTVLSIGGYREVRVALGDKLYIERNLPYQPLPIYLLVQAFPPVLNPPSSRTKQKLTVRKGKREGDPVTCVETRFGHDTSSMCFSDQSGVLLEMANGGMKWRYSEFSPYRDKPVAHSIKTYNMSQLVAELKINDISELPAKPALVPPTRSLVLGWCEAPLSPDLEEKQTPHYPSLARQRGQQGQVGVYATVGSDGHLHNISIAQTAGPDLDQSTLAALQNWRYRPATCNGRPVESETFIFVNYTLSPY